MTAQGTRKGEPSLPSMRNGLRPQPARLVRGSSRRIMSMRFRPANIRVINRRASSSLSSALLSEPRTLKAHQQEPCSRRAARPVALMPESVLAGKGSLRRAKHRRALDSSARFRRKTDCDGRLRREHSEGHRARSIRNSLWVSPDGDTQRLTSGINCQSSVDP